MINTETLIELLIDSLYNTISKDIDHPFTLHELINDAYLSIERKILISNDSKYYVFLNYHYNYFGKTYYVLLELPDNPIDFLDRLNIALDKYKSIFKNHNRLISSDKFYNSYPNGDHKSNSYNNKQYLSYLSKSKD